MVDEMTAQREDVGWMTEAHRLSLGANRSSRRPAMTGNASCLSRMALVQPDRKIVVFSMYEDPAIALPALEAGARGDITKQRH